MFVVYLGAHDIENNLPEVNASISKIIIVNSFTRFTVLKLN